MVTPISTFKPVFIKRITRSFLTVRSNIGSWEKREKPIKPGERGIYTRLFTSKYIFDRAEEIEELKLEND